MKIETVAPPVVSFVSKASRSSQYPGNPELVENLQKVMSGRDSSVSFNSALMSSALGALSF